GLATSEKGCEISGNLGRRRSAARRATDAAHQSRWLNNAPVNFRSLRARRAVRLRAVNCAPQFDAAQQKLAEAACLFDLSEHPVSARSMRWRTISRCLFM